MRILITGGSGYIGSRLTAALRLVGHQVFITTRDKYNLSDQVMYFDLSNGEVDLSIPVDTDIVFHLAAITRENFGNDDDLEVLGSISIIKAAKKVGAKLIYISSQTAREDAPTLYGRTKWKIEQLVLSARGCVIRPGLVYGGYANGQFGMLCRIMRALPFFPVFLPSLNVQPIHLDDLVNGLVGCVSHKKMNSSIIHLGSEIPISFSRFLYTLSRYRIKRFSIPVLMPTFVIHVIIYLYRCLGAQFNAIESLISLMQLRVMNTKEGLSTLNIDMRSLNSGMRGSGIRRDLISEALIFYKYILRANPSSALMRRYVRAIQNTGNGRPLYFSGVLIRFPILLAIIECTKYGSLPFRRDFFWRLNVAVALSEASILGAKRFLEASNADEHPSIYLATQRLMFICTSIFSELILRIICCIAHPFGRLAFLNAH